MEPENLVTFSLQPNPNRYPAARAALLHDQLRERLAALAGVKDVSYAQVPALTGHSSTTMLTVPGFAPRGEDDSRCHYNEVGPDYFRTLGIPLVRGREIGLADGDGTPKVAVVNEAFARHFFGGRNPIGERFAIGMGKVVPDVEIVGVVKDALYASMREPPPRVFYRPSRQLPGGTGRSFYLRTVVEPESLLAPVRKEVAAAAPDHPVRRLKTLEQQIGENVARDRDLAGLTGAFAALATLLAGIGLYGVLSYDTSRRTREIGIRMALGADSARVRRLVARELAVMLAVGTAAGTAAAVAAGRLFESLFYGTTAWDPGVYAAATGVLLVMACAAVYVPTRRACRVDPMQALRHE